MLTVLHAVQDYTVLLEWVVQLNDEEAKEYLVDYLGDECKAFAEEFTAIRTAMIAT